MIGDEILKQIKDRRTDAHQFIKWWRKEEDFLDFDRIDSFIENIEPGEEIGGFDLFTMEEMWENLEKVTSSRVERTKKRGEDVIVWQKKSGEEQVCPFNAESVMTIFDVETHGDLID
jgi:hypothetical protein